MPIELVQVPGRKFLSWCASWARSREAGPVVSQYARELAEEAAGVTAHGLFACGQAIGGFSTGTHSLPRGGTSVRLDLVLVQPRLRRKGLGALLMAEYLGEALVGNRAELVSAMAVHPAVRRVLTRLGFERVDVSADVPLYRLRVGKHDRNEIRREAQTAVTALRDRFMLRCEQCRRQSGGARWCEGPGEWLASGRTGSPREPRG